MFIQTEETPNPDTIKFLPGRVVMTKGTADFRSIEDASQQSPLAKILFGAEGVTGVFLGADFIAVSKKTDVDWAILKPSILGTIMEHFVTNQPLFFEQQSSKQHQVETDPIIKQIKEIIDTRVRPAVAMDGGDIIFDRFENGIVYLHMQGACSGCPSSTITLKSGIENMLKHYVPEVVEVQALEN